MNIGNNWQLKFVKKYKAQLDKTTNKRIIKPFTINNSFFSNYLAIGVVVNNSRNTWQNGGEIAQEVFLPNTGQYRTNNVILKDFYSLRINEINLVQFESFLGNYKIKYFPQSYFQQIELRIWEYQNKEIVLSHSLQLINDSINDIKVLVEQQNKTLKFIINKLDCNGSVATTSIEKQFFFIN